VLDNNFDCEHFAVVAAVVCPFEENFSTLEENFEKNDYDEKKKEKEG
jgi:hypothetical protein